MGREVLAEHLLRLPSSEGLTEVGLLPRCSLTWLASQCDYWWGAPVPLHGGLPTGLLEHPPGIVTESSPRTSNSGNQGRCCSALCDKALELHTATLAIFSWSQCPNLIYYRWKLHKKHKCPKVKLTGSHLGDWLLWKIREEGKEGTLKA